MRELLALYNEGRYQDVVTRGEALAKQFPEAPIIRDLLGAAHDGLGCLEQAAICFRLAVELKPDSVESHINLGIVLNDLGQFAEAAASYRKALQLQPDNVEANTNLGVVLFELGRLDEAEASYRQALQIAPDNAAAHHNLGLVWHDRGDLEQAMASFQKAVECNPANAESHSNLGNALRALGKLNDAVAHYQLALQLNPGQAGTLNNLAITLIELGETDEAIRNYEKALQLDPDRARLHWNLSTAKDYRAGDPHIEQMLQLLERPALPDHDRSQLSFALGKAFGDTGDQREAMHYLVEGNRLRKKELQYSSASDRALFARIRATFSASVSPLEVAEQAHRVRSPHPVFVLGMPRSGTSLVEQILASHSLVHGGGEMKLLNQLVRAAEWNASILSAKSLQSIRASYLSGLGEIGVSEPYITDKMPHNFLWIGFIVAALPEARIVHVQRDARATCWSNFRHGFFDRGYGYACDLQDVAEHFKMYSELMAFWHELWPGRIYDLNYEALTEDQENETRKLLEYVGLNWEDQCLAFQRTQRAVRTASAQQVRREMYQGSSDEWRKYEKYLAPMVELLKAF